MRRGPSRGRRALAAAAVVLGLACGCTGRVPAGPALSHVGLHDLGPCPGLPGFSCGSLSVRLDPFGPAPGALSLRAAMSDAAAAPRGVLVLLTGGPGEAGVAFAARLAGRLGPALRGYRLVMLDQRGTAAGALNCPALQRQMGTSDLTVPRRPRSGRARRPSGLTAGTSPPRTRSPTSRHCGGRSGSPGSPWTASRTVPTSRSSSHWRTRARSAGWCSTRWCRRGTWTRSSSTPCGGPPPCCGTPARPRAAPPIPPPTWPRWSAGYHDGPALLDTLVALSIGAPSFPASRPRCTRPRPGARPGWTG